MKPNKISTITLFIVFCSVEYISSASVVVKTELGKVIGTQEVQLGRLVDKFLGIPFAKPPVGDLRFKPPQQIDKKWPSPINATKFSAKCPANFPLDPGEKSEDCLYLNIWRPADVSPSRLLPVMFWIYGGSFLFGSSSFPVYDGRAFAAIGDVILVTFNYRIGALGFLNVDSSESPGNQGLHDQVLALKWVNEHIQNFGGDNKNITLFGESAGGFSVGYHMISPLSRNLFQRGIMQSGCPSDFLSNADSRKSLEAAHMFALAAGCSNERINIKTNPKRVMKCLRKLSFQRIIAIQDVMTKGWRNVFPPIHGDSFLPKAPYKALTEGDIGPQKDVIIGVNKDEGTLFASFAYAKTGFSFVSPDISAVQVKQRIKSLLPELKGVDINRAFSIYMDRGRSSPFRALSDAIGDYVFVCPAIVTAMKLANAGRNVYFYVFTYRADGSLIPKHMGVAHSEEVPLVFGFPLHFNWFYSKRDEEFSESLVKTWAGFATLGGAALTKWKKFTAKDQHFFVLDPRTTNIDLLQFRNRTCQFWIKNEMFLN